MTTADIILRRASDILGSKRDENCSPGSVDSVNSEIARVKDGKELLALFERYVDSRGCKQVFSVTQMVKIGSVNSIFMRKCLSDDKFWDRNLVEKLILSKTVSVMEHRDLIQKIIQHNDIVSTFCILAAFSL